MDAVRNLIISFFKSRIKRIIWIVIIYTLLICLLPVWGILIQKINAMNMADTIDGFIKIFDIAILYNSTLFQILTIILLILSIYLMLFYNYKGKRIVYFLGYLLFIIISMTRMINNKILQYANFQKLNSSDYVNENIIYVDDQRINTLYSITQINSMDKIIKITLDGQNNIIITYNKNDYSKKDIKKYIDYMIITGFEERQEKSTLIYEKGKYCFTNIEKEEKYIFVYGKC